MNAPDVHGTHVEHPGGRGRTAFLGVGVMGEAVLSGLIRAGWDPASIVGTSRRAARREELIARHGVRAGSNVDAVQGADTVVIGVKPMDVPGVLDEVAELLEPGAVVISLAAGLTTAQLEEHLPEHTAVIRVMPNTPSLVGQGMAVVSAGTAADQAAVDRAVQLMEAVGRVQVVPESYQDAVTAISGSGPAYLFFVAEAMIEAGVHLGLPRSVSTELVGQTMMGSAVLLRDSGTHPTVLREQVTSPGGTTAAAIRQLEASGVRAAFMRAMEAARDRSAEMAEQSRGRS